MIINYIFLRPIPPTRARRLRRPRPSSPTRSSSSNSSRRPNPSSSPTSSSPTSATRKINAAFRSRRRPRTIRSRHRPTPVSRRARCPPGFSALDTPTGRRRVGSKRSCSSVDCQIVSRGRSSREKVQSVRIARLQTASHGVHQQSAAAFERRIRAQQVPHGRTSTSARQRARLERGADQDLVSE